MNVTGWRKFIKLCRIAEDEKKLSQLLECFLTVEEQENIATRALIIFELLKGEKTQREIAKSLKVSIAKITRGSNELKRITPQLENFLKKQLL